MGIIQTLLQKVKNHGHCDGTPTLEVVPPNGNLQCCCRRLYETLLSVASEIQIGGVKVRLISFNAPKEEVRLSVLCNPMTPSPSFNLPTLFPNSRALNHILDNSSYSNKRFSQILHAHTTTKEYKGYILTGLQAFFPACHDRSIRLLTTMNDNTLEEYRALLEEVMERIEHLGNCFLIQSYATARWFGTVIILSTKNPMDFKHEVLKTFPDGETCLSLYLLSGESISSYSCSLKGCINRIEEITRVELDTHALIPEKASSPCVILLNALQDQDHRHPTRIEQIVAEIWDECEKAIEGEGSVESISLAAHSPQVLKELDFVDPKSQVDVSFCGLSLRQHLPWEGMLIIKIIDDVEEHLSKLIHHFHKKLYRGRTILATQTHVSL